MSRPLLILIVLLVVIVGLAIWGGSRATETPQTRIELPVENGALAN